MPCTCNNTNTCGHCVSCASTTCVQPVVLTPLTRCGDAIEYCTDGCVDTQNCECVLYKGPHLGTLDLHDGDTLCKALTAIDYVLNNIMIGTVNFPNFVYSVPCMTNEENNITLTAFTKDGVAQITGPVQYPNAQSLLAFLQTTDLRWEFDAPNQFHISSNHTWTMTISCSTV